MIAKQNIRLHITLPKEVIKLLDKKRSSNKYFVYTRSEYIKNLIIKNETNRLSL